MVEKDVNNPEVSPDLSESGQGDSSPDQIDGQAEKRTDSQSTEQPQKGSEVGSSDSQEEDLPKSYKELRAEFTRRTQEWAEKEKKYAELEKKLKELEENPYFQQWTEEMKKMAQAQQTQEPDWDSMTEEEKFNYLVDQRVKEILDKEVKPFIDATMIEKAQDTLNRFFSEHPEAKDRQDEIADVMEKYNMPIDEAWKFLTVDEIKEKTKQEVLAELEAKKKANLEVPGRKPSSPTIKKGMSVEEAYELAKRQAGLK